MWVQRVQSPGGLPNCHASIMCGDVQVMVRLMVGLMGRRDFRLLLARLGTNAAAKMSFVNFNFVF
jgi:hypothetical protein